MAGLAERVAASPQDRAHVTAYERSRKRLLEEGPMPVLVFYNEVFRRLPPTLAMYRVAAPRVTGRASMIANELFPSV